MILVLIVDAILKNSFKVIFSFIICVCVYIIGHIKI